MDRSVPEGSRATASEQMQPVYEIRNQVGQQQQQLDAISTLIQVACVAMVTDITIVNSQFHQYSVFNAEGGWGPWISLPSQAVIYLGDGKRLILEL